MLLSSTVEGLEALEMQLNPEKKAGRCSTLC
jgi:hypothetical protein